MDHLTNHSWHLFQPISGEQETNRKLPISRESSMSRQVGVVPKGKITSVQLSELFAKRLEDPDEWTKYKLAEHYKLDKEALSSVLKYYSDYTVVAKAELPRPLNPSVLGWHKCLWCDHWRWLILYVREISYGVNLVVFGSHAFRQSRFSQFLKKREVRLRTVSINLNSMYFLVKSVWPLIFSRQFWENRRQKSDRLARDCGQDFTCNNFVSSSSTICHNLTLVRPQEFESDFRVLRLMLVG